MCPSSTSAASRFGAPLHIMLGEFASLFDPDFVPEWP
jgi:hypothetical protein